MMLYAHYYRIWNENDYYVAISDLEDESLPPLAGTDVIALIHLVVTYEKDFTPARTGRGLLNLKPRVRISPGVPVYAVVA